MPIKRSSFLTLYKSLPAIVALALLVLANGESATLSTSISIIQSPVAEQRKIHIRKPPRVPLAVTAVRNLQSENWLQDLEIEVKNNSSKPIYYLSIILFFPDLPKSTEADGREREYGMLLIYGRGELTQSDKFASAEDVPVRSGEKYVFKIPESYRKGIEFYLSQNNLPVTTIKDINVVVSSLSFGDGSGFVGGAPFSFKKTSQNNSNTERHEQRFVMLVNGLLDVSYFAPDSVPSPIPKTIDLYANTRAAPQSISCGPYQSGCGYYQEITQTCPLPNTCNSRHYSGRTSGDCYKILEYGYFYCQLPDGTQFLCTFDYAASCDDYIRCGGCTNIDVCLECEGSGGNWNTSTCTCSNPCDPVERQNCLNTGNGMERKNVFL